jgi:Flp pilus assembly pilin Flp
MTLVKQFLKDESGAVTVDWVVLTAAIVGLGIAVIAAIATSIGTVTQATDFDLRQADNFADRVSNAVTTP